MNVPGCIMAVGREDFNPQPNGSEPGLRLRLHPGGEANSSRDSVLSTGGLGVLSGYIELES